MAMRQFRVDEDTGDVSPTKPRKLRPLDDEETPPTKPKSALKSALKGAPPPEPAMEPKPPSGSPPKSAMKSALKRAPMPEPEEEPLQPSAPKSALKKSNQTMQPVPPAQPPPNKAKSALKSRAVPPEEPPAMVSNETPTKSAGMQPTALSRPSVYRMNVSISDDGAWTAKGLCTHYFFMAGQRWLWEQNKFGDHRSRKSIKHDDLIIQGRASIKSGQKLVKGQSWVIESSNRGSQLKQQQEAIVEVHHGVISPLKDLFLEKKPSADTLRAILSGMSDAERAKWVNAPLDDTPPPMPAPLFSAVAAVHANLVEVLIEFGVDVKAQYPGKSMLKGWIKPQTPLVECVVGRKGRFLGTMLGDKLTSIEGMLNMAMKAGAVEVVEPVKVTAKQAPGRRKSVQMKCVQGVMEHTHDHPSSKYELVSMYEDGNPSNVREAMNIESGDIFAIKAGNKMDEASAKDPEAEMWNEIGIIRKLDHPNLVRLHETFENDTHIFMVLEGCLGGELFDRLVTDGCFSEQNALRIGYQIGSALRHLHQLQICHRDIQPECFFLAEEGPLEETGVKLIDFATAREFSGDGRMHTKICTLHYVAPEILTSSDGYTEKVDIWSFGVMMYIMLSGVPPFNSDQSDLDILQLVKDCNYQFAPDSVWKDVSNEAKDLISKCLELDVNKRLDTWGIMGHPAMVHAEDHGAVYTASESLGRSATSTKEGKCSKTNPVRLAFSMMAEMITDEQLDQLRNLFKELDTEECGMVELDASVGEVRKMFEDNEEAKELVKLLNDENVSGRVNYTMYLATMTDRRRHLRREAARCVFNNFDIDKNGNISLYEIAQALSHSDAPPLAKHGNISMKEVQKIWSEMRDHFKMQKDQTLSDREMTFDEFFKELPNSNKDISF